MNTTNNNNTTTQDTQNMITPITPEESAIVGTGKYATTQGMIQLEEMYSSPWGYTPFVEWNEWDRAKYNTLFSMIMVQLVEMANNGVQTFVPQRVPDAEKCDNRGKFVSVHGPIAGRAIEATA